MYNDEKLEFKEIPSKLNDIIKNIDNEKIKKFRWFQEKACTILEKYLYDYAILLQDEFKIIIAAIIAFVTENPETKERKTSLYYFPLIATKSKLLANDVLEVIMGSDFSASIYDAVDDIDYIKCIDKILYDESTAYFKSNAKLVSVKLEPQDIYRTEKLSNKSSNSLTFLKKDEIVKTYRKLADGINPDLEMTIKLREKGFKNVQGIRGYFLYIDKDRKNYTVAMVVEYIKNIADMWQYTQEYLKSFLTEIKNIKDVDPAFLENYCSDYLYQIKNIAEIIADMHIRLSSIQEDGFTKREPSSEDLDELLNSITGNFNTLLSFIKAEKFDEPINSMVKEISEQKDFLTIKINEFKGIYRNFGKYMRCHADLHLEQILKTKDDYILIDFEGEPTKPIGVRRKRVSPLKDIAGMVRSFNYAAYAAYFNYLEANCEDVNESIEKALTLWADVVTNSFIDCYFNAVKESAPDIIPDEEHFNTVLALFKLDKALFEGLYEVNNRPAWFKIPLKGILECIDDLKSKKERAEVTYG